MVKTKRNNIIVRKIKFQMRMKISIEIRKRKNPEAKKYQDL